MCVYQFRHLGIEFNDCSLGLNYNGVYRCCGAALYGLGFYL